MKKIIAKIRSMNKFFNSMADKQFEVKHENFQSLEFRGIRTFR